MSMIFDIQIWWHCRRWYKILGYFIGWIIICSGIVMMLFFVSYKSVYMGKAVSFEVVGTETTQQSIFGRLNSYHEVIYVTTDMGFVVKVKTLSYIGQPIYEDKQMLKFHIIPFDCKIE